MDYHLDRKVVLREESEHKGLYKWSLQELDENDKKVGRDLIPWNWNLYFTATELSLSEELSLERDPFAKDGEKVTVKESGHIRAKLWPGHMGASLRTESYSMMGTKRSIESFNLLISPTSIDENVEKCRAWGCVSYTDDGDFRRETTEDTVQFYVIVSPERFARYADMVRRYPANSMVLRVSAVHGFYSDWSPDIHTDSVKVLANLEDQKIILGESNKITPPVLGEIGECDVRFITTRSCEKPLVPVDEALGEEPENPQKTAEEQTTIFQQASLKLGIAHAHRLNRLSYAAWAIVVLLIVLLLR